LRERKRLGEHASDEEKNVDEHVDGEKRACSGRDLKLRSAGSALLYPRTHRVHGCEPSHAAANGIHLRVVQHGTTAQEDALVLAREIMAVGRRCLPVRLAEAVSAPLVQALANHIRLLCRYMAL
jgi:hypothetical protein